MPILALLAVLLAACTHASWNIVAKQAAHSRHFVWLYSVGSVLIWSPAVAWVLIYTQPRFGILQAVALLATALLHLAYSLTLQAGYRAGDLSLIYPIARGSGPLFSFVGAVVLLGEHAGLYSIAGLILIVSGIALVAGLTRLGSRRAPWRGISWGLSIGACIAAYTLNDGWAVKVLAISPLLIDYTGNCFRAIVLSPRALADRSSLAQEVRQFARPALIVGVLGPLGYILVLFAMRVAPISHVAPARELSTLVGTYFGARLLSEPVTATRVVGALCIVAGVVSLALAN